MKDAMIIDDLYWNRKPRAYETIAPALRANRGGQKVLEVYDVYNKRLRDKTVCGTLTTNPQNAGGCGTFWILEIDNGKTNKDN